MRIYKTTYKTSTILPDGRRACKIKWHSSGDAASKARTAIKAEDKTAEPTTEEVDVPTDKTGLLEFLNKLTD